MKIKIESKDYEVIGSGCLECGYAIAHEDEDKWGPLCGACGRSKEKRMELQKIYEGMALYHYQLICANEEMLRSELKRVNKLIYERIKLYTDYD